MGTLADKTLRRKRMEAHAALDRLMAASGMQKKQAYRWLQLQLGLPEEDTHIGKFSGPYCQKTILLCDTFVRSCRPAA